MINKSEKPDVFTKTPERPGEFRRVFRILLSRGLTVFGLFIVLALLITAIFAPQIAPYDPYEQNLRNSLATPSSQHLLGTDALGRDTLSRMIFGARTALMVGMIATGIAAIVGIAMGLVAGYFGGWVHAIIMRFVDTLMAFPFLVLALLLAVLLGGGLHNIMIAVGFGLSSQYARVACGMALSVKQNDYVLAARAIGAGNLRIMMRHVLINIFPPMIVLITLNFGGAISIEAALSYLGIGIEPPGAAWGSMVKDGYRYLISNPILALVPGVAIMLVVYAFNMVGDGLRDALDPRLRGTL